MQAQLTTDIESHARFLVAVDFPPKLLQVRLKSTHVAENSRPYASVPDECEVTCPREGADGAVS